VIKAEPYKHGARPLNVNVNVKLYSRTGVLKVVPQYPQWVSKRILEGIQKGILKKKSP